ncbi:MAG: hypothetical protein KDE45_23135 [Caldilineaceae bacterium]|nr:hypothetical protein [Caldilineaceae bacterium]
MIELLLYTTLAGIAIPLGGCIATIEHIHPNWLEQELRHTVIAVGGGALISAVALVLIPEGIAAIAAWESVSAFVAGGLAFWGLQLVLAHSRSSASQLTAMLSDFIPEVIALGATIAAGEAGAMVLAAIIVMQNLPEGFNAYRELFDSGVGKKTILTAFVAAALLGPLLGAFGFLMLADSPRVLGWLQVFAAAGILYLVFEDVAPKVRLKNSHFPALGAILGFLLGLLGKLAVG